MDHQHIQDDHSAMNTTSYFYPDQEPPFVGYATQQIPGYQVNTRNQLDLHHQPQGQMQYHNLSLISPHQYTNPVYGTSSPPHGSLPLSTSPPPPPSPDMYDPLSPPVSGSDTSADGLHYHSNSSGANSPASSRANSLVHRTVRYNPTPSPTSSSGRRRSRSRESDDDNDMGASYVENLANTRKEATRRQRIEAEQRRRDELRDGYAKLKDVLPVSNQKSSKVSLLDRATNHITHLEKLNRELQARLAELEAEMTRLRAMNEKISLQSAETPSPGMFDNKPLSPPPESLNAKPQKSRRARDSHSEASSPSGSENGY
ncbi:hypothetical protein H0H92_004494 [Tricholoma furcatifolium]|nr:hypothetical protein H0H92_004494 [Tricholoma furcatifolium]